MPAAKSFCMPTARRGDCDVGESPRIGRARSDADQIERESLLRDAGDIACLRDPEAVLSLLGRLLIQHVPGDVFAAFVPDLVANEVRVAGQSGPQDRKHPLCEPTRLSEARQLLAKTIAGRRYLAASTRNSSPLGRVLFSFGVGCGLLLELRSGEGSNGWPLIARESPTTPFDAPSTNRALGLVRLAVAALDNSRRVHQLREKADTASSFVANLSHELRTPLHVIMGYAEMLNDGELGPHTQAQHDLTQRIGASAR